jgi:sphingomyelin phosphodiesterase acid-like 3
VRNCAACEVSLTIRRSFAVLVRSVLVPAVFVSAMLPGARAAAVPAETKPVFMLSDIHLDPFHDPAKFPALLAAPAAGWKAILNAPASATQAADFEKLQTTCGTRGVDTPIALLESALHAAKVQQPAPLFVTVSGDLMAHKFDCKFEQLAARVPGRKPGAADYSAFASKTVAFVAEQLHATFPEVPVYFALGNNDSGCHDYDEDPGSEFLKADGAAFADDVLTPGNRAAVEKKFSEFGDYNVALPIAHTRLLVVQDIFESSKFAPCDRKATGDPAAGQIAWLRSQLLAARAAHEQVWVMAHIPPGIDAYSTFTKGKDACTGATPEMFLRGGGLAAAIAEFPDVIRLALFGHTHMDEMRLYHAADGTPIPGKLVPSISPVNGNTPAFTLAQVSATTATLVDYTVYAATANAEWTNATKWAAEYTFSAAYRLPDLSGASMEKLLDGFVADKAGSGELSSEYAKNFFVGDPMLGAGKASFRAMAMKMVWPLYACSMTQTSAAGFKGCMCPAGK